VEGGRRHNWKEGGEAKVERKGRKRKKMLLLAAKDCE
jgi:hypothetical protein